MRFGTKAIHAALRPDPSTGAVITPIFQTSTFVQPSPGQTLGFDYSRTNNPTRQFLEENLASLEGARHCIAYSSGMAAITNVVNMFGPGTHIISCDDLYGGTYRLFQKVMAKYGIDFNYVDMTDLSNVEKALMPSTKLIWAETPSNPLLKIADMAALCAMAKDRGIMVVVDNTFMSPYFQRPLDFGADIVVHSTTKYINGHSDIIGGAAMTNDAELGEKLRFLQNAIGAVPSPFDCWLTLRGVKTLHLRMQAHQHNALAVARFLAGHRSASRVIYPGLESHPQHQLAVKQMSGFGGIVSFEVKGGLKAAVSFLEKLKIFALAESLGGIESLAEHPALMTHASVPAEVRRKLGITDGLIRLSVGIEDEADLIEDLEIALS